MAGKFSLAQGDHFEGRYYFTILSPIHFFNEDRRLLEKKLGFGLSHTFFSDATKTHLYSSSQKTPLTPEQFETIRDQGLNLQMGPNQAAALEKQGMNLDTLAYYGVKTPQNS